MAFYVTTSWDDGSVHDLRVAELLTRYGVRGTFYIPIEFTEKGSKFSEYERRLNEEELVKLSTHHEIGAHTVHHLPLSGLSEKEVMEELTESKKILETMLGKEVPMFCFPRSDFNERVVELVKAAGFRGSRTTKKLSYKLPTDPYRMPVSMQAAPFPFRRKDASTYYYRRLLDPMRTYFARLITMPYLWPKLLSWRTFSRGVVAHTRTHGNYFHLYGHSWELEKYGMWQELEDFLCYLQSCKDGTFLTNSELLTHMRIESSELTELKC